MPEAGPSGRLVMMMMLAGAGERLLPFTSDRPKAYRSVQRHLPAYLGPVDVVAGEDEDHFRPFPLYVSRFWQIASAVLW